MRRLTLLGAGTALLVMLMAGSASAQTSIQITGMTCSTLSATGSQLPANADLDLAIINQDTGEVLRSLKATTDANGSFKVSAKVPTGGVRDIRLLVASRGTQIGFADHAMAAGHEMCPLPNTGPGEYALLLAIGAGMLAGGAALLRTQAYRGTHLAR
jgi:LPXTG-motif cell wall-anchored protein